MTIGKTMVSPDLWKQQPGPWVNPENTNQLGSSFGSVVGSWVGAGSGIGGVQLWGPWHCWCGATQKPCMTDLVDHEVGAYGKTSEILLEAVKYIGIALGYLYNS